MEYPGHTNPIQRPDQGGSSYMSRSEQCCNQRFRALTWLVGRKGIRVFERGYDVLVRILMVVMAWIVGDAVGVRNIDNVVVAAAAAAAAVAVPAAASYNLDWT